MALEKVPHPIHINFQYPPYPGAALKTIELDLPEGALLLDAIRQCRIQHHVPVYLEHSFLSTAQTLIESTRRARVDQEIARVNTTLFSQGTTITNATTTNGKPSDEKSSTTNSNSAKSVTSTVEDDPEEDDSAEAELQRAMIENYRNHTSQFYTQPEENMFPEAYHTLVHSPIPSLFDSVLDLEREYAGEVDALLSARDAEINDIQTRHNNILAAEAPQRNLTQLMTRHIERMEVSQATWNSQLDDLQSMQRSKYQEFILELYAIYKRQQLNLSHKDTPNGKVTSLDGKEMVAEAMRTIGARQSNVGGTPSQWAQQLHNDTSEHKDLPPVPSTAESQPDPSGAEEPAPPPPPADTVPETSATEAPQETVAVDTPPPSLPSKADDPELELMIKSILEMGFDVEQAKGALLISNRDMDHAINMLLEQPENIPRLVAAKQKVAAMKENSARRQNRALSSPQQPLPSLTGSPASNTSQPHTSQDPRIQNVNRPIDRSASVSYPRPHISGQTQGSSGGAGTQKPWSPLPFFQQQRNALLTNNSNPSVKKFGGWLNKAMENLGLDDDFEDQNGSNRNGGLSSSAQPFKQQVSNLAESFTVVLGSSHSKVTHNLRLVVSDPAEVFPSNRNKSERDAAIQAQTASSLYGKNLTGLVQLVNIRDWAKYKGGQVCHQELFKACQTSTELHFDSIEKQLEALEEDIPLNGSTLQEGDFVLTRHSNLPMIHVVFHLFYGSSSGSAATTTTGTGAGLPNLFSQSSDFVPKPDFLAGLRNIMRTAHRYEITMLSLPFLMMPTSFENQLVAASEPTPPTRHHRSGSQYGSPSLSAISTGASGAGSTISPPSVSSLASFSSGPNQQQPQVSYHISDQTRRDLQKRTETTLRHLKSYLMENARQVKQVGNQGSEAEKFRASQGGDVMVVQFLLPKGTSDEMFRSFRGTLVNVFGDEVRNQNGEIYKKYILDRTFQVQGHMNADQFLPEADVTDNPIQVAMTLQVSNKSSDIDNTTWHQISHDTDSRIFMTPPYDVADPSENGCHQLWVRTVAILATKISIHTQGLYVATSKRNMATSQMQAGRPIAFCQAKDLNSLTSSSSTLWLRRRRSASRHPKSIRLVGAATQEAYHRRGFVTTIYQPVLFGDVVATRSLTLERQAWRIKLAEKVAQSEQEQQRYMSGVFWSSPIDATSNPHNLQEQCCPYPVQKNQPFEPSSAAE
ncbi:hypothetical protein BGZ96_004997 [Linnemannia gamsii]|uniref:UBA domain-containing protein n=1 Tax=Linnemannia gamsii TaxID=64522 RepID=A0ABQ7K7M0_9FUNG|nr:hypothetical protein BGZ96_004997 [Linnemannia gamsii]